MGSVLLLIAVIIFALAAFGVSPGGLGMVPLGLAFFAAAGLAGGGWPWKGSAS